MTKQKTKTIWRTFFNRDTFACLFARRVFGLDAPRCLGSCSPRWCEYLQRRPRRHLPCRKNLHTRAASLRAPRPPPRSSLRLANLAANDSSSCCCCSAFDSRARLRLLIFSSFFFFFFFLHLFDYLLLIIIIMWFKNCFKDTNKQKVYILVG